MTVTIPVCSWSLEPAKLNSAFSWVARRSLPTAPPSRALSQDMLRRWERAAREQTVMCNQAAGLSRCLTRVQDAMSSQLKTLHLDGLCKTFLKGFSSVWRTLPFTQRQLFRVPACWCEARHPYCSVHMSSQPVKCQSSFRWTIGCARRWKR